MVEIPSVNNSVYYRALGSYWVLYSFLVFIVDQFCCSDIAHGLGYVGNRFRTKYPITQIIDMLVHCDLI